MTAAVMTRLSKGSRLQDAYPVLTKPPTLSDIDSAFQIQEYISHVIRMDVHDVNRIVSIPGSSSTIIGGGGKKQEETNKTGEKGNVGLGLGINMQSGEDKSNDKGGTSASSSGSRERESSSGVDEACWIYEQLRRLAQDLTHPLLTSLQAECNRNTCPEMKAGEWLYLCVAHGTGSGTTGGMEVRYQCCAIDYIVHTLDSATALLNSPRHFPSRLQIPQASTRHFGALARRLSRIFAHAYYHHREAFEQAEADSSLYARFLLLAQKFDLVPAEFLALPSTSPSATSEPQQNTQQQQSQPQQQQRILLHSGGTVIGPGLATSSAPLQQIQIQPANPPPSGTAPAPPLTVIGTGAPPPPNVPPPYPPSSQQHTTRAESPALGRREEGTVMNRSRTDTMYSQSGGFNLQQFASSDGTLPPPSTSTLPTEETAEGGSKAEEDGDGMMEVDLGTGPSPIVGHAAGGIVGYAAGGPETREGTKQRDLGVPYSTPPLPPPTSTKDGGIDDNDAEAPPEPELHASTAKSTHELGGEDEDDEVEFDLLDGEGPTTETKAQPIEGQDAEDDEEEDDGVEVEKPDEGEGEAGTGVEEPAPTPGAGSGTSAIGHPDLNRPVEDLDASVDEVDKALLAVEEEGNEESKD